MQMPRADRYRARQSRGPPPRNVNLTFGDSESRLLMTCARTVACSKHVFSEIPQIPLPGYTAEPYPSIIERPCPSRKSGIPTGKASRNRCSTVPVGQNSNGIDSTVARLSFGMKWMYHRVVR